MPDEHPPVAVVNISTVCTAEEVLHWVAAIQTFMPEFCAAWGLAEVAVGIVPRGTPMPDGMWQQILADDSDQAGALGYHEESANGFPIGFTFAKTDQRFGSSISATLSHELWEMLADPFISDIVVAPDGRHFIKENADAVEADADGISLPMPSGPSVLLSDFVLPSYFDFAAPEGVAYDYRGLLTKPIPAMLPGGYLAYQNPDGSWGQIDARATPAARAQVRPHVLSRRYRRMFRTWQRSTAA